MPSAEATFVHPTSLEAAIGELAQDDALLVGGGTSLALLVRTGLIEPSKFVSLASVPSLRGIVEQDGSLLIGASTTFRELALDNRVVTRLPALALAASVVGNPRVRAVATMGGALCHGDARQDVPPPLLSLGATVLIEGPEGGREVPLDGFYLGFMDVDLAENEVLRAVRVPLVDAVRSIYVRFNPSSEDDYPVVGVAASVRLDNEGSVADARIALGGLGTTAFVAKEAADVLQGQLPSAEVIAAAASAAARVSSPTSDNRGSAEYKTAMAEVIVRRALQGCLT